MLLLFLKKILEHLMIFISIIFFIYLFVKHLPSVEGWCLLLFIDLADWAIWGR